MQTIRQCVRNVALYSRFIVNKTDVSNVAKTLNLISTCSFHLSSICGKHTSDFKTPTHFLDYNKIIFPPQKPGEERRPAYVCHMKANIKYSPKKMWYIASYIRGMSVDEAIKVLSFMRRKGGEIAKQIVLEAQKMAVEEHNVEFKSNLWVAESFSTKGIVIKGIRRHARGRGAIQRYRYCHYFVRLEEGQPPKNYCLRNPKSGEELLNNWLKNMHMRKVFNSL